ncbi:MAG: ATP-binding protein, partial [Planctomycetes bacterium]|nr:ATP-binding protein [Planctomycetota bacterium]
MSADPALAPPRETPPAVLLSSGDGPAPAQPLAALLRFPAGSAAEVVLPWLVRLRWVAVSGQALTVLLVWWLLEAQLPVWPLVAIIFFAAASNVVLQQLLARRAPDRGLVPAVLTLDTLLLTLLLYFSGGPTNPFGVLYVVHVAMAATVLSPRWTWWMVALSALCYGALFLDHVPLHLAGGEVSPRVFLLGSWVALILVAAVTAVFIERISTALRRREDQLTHARTLAERNERLASLTTLAAGAAHELGTPLGTIAVVARELERAAERLRQATPEGDEEALGRLGGLMEDARLVRAEVDRCRRILDRMGAQAERSVVPPPARVAPADLLADLREELPASQRPVLRLDDRAGHVDVPREDLVQALLPLVTNAFDATEGAGPVNLEVSRDGPLLRFVVRDAGAGMPPDVLARASEPFFTTKPPGRGTGLGLYLVRLLAERLGGRLRIESRAPGGTRADPAPAGARRPAPRGGAPHPPPPLFGPPNPGGP